MRRVRPLEKVLATADPDAPGRSTFGVPTFGGATPSTGDPTGSLPAPVIAFCSDEDIARRAVADFAQLAGESQVLARGSDGGMGADAWTLTSASVDLASQGVQDGDVLQLDLGRRTGASTSYAGPKQLLAIDAVSGHSATLRRLGLATGMGDPPMPAGGYPNPVEFKVPTLYPQILDASRDLRQIYGLDELILGRRTSDLYDLTQFVEACAFKVLAHRYLEMSRSAGKENADDYRAKSAMYKDELQSTLDRLAIHFKPSPLPQAEVTRFGCRLVR
jgi:hypothetical protein